MAIRTFLTVASLDGDYGVKVDGMLRITCEITPADKAPRDRYGLAEYPDSPEQIEIIEVRMRLGLGDGFHKLTTFDHAAIEAAVQEELAAQRQRDAAMAREFA